MNGYCPSTVDASCSQNEIRSCNEDSGTMSSEPEDSNKTSHVSDDGMSSLSTESGQSILSSEYGNQCGLTEFTSTSIFDLKPILSSTHHCKISPNISPAIVKERIDNLKDLPPELAAMVQKALHELDMREFDDVITAVGESSSVTEETVTVN